MAFFVWQDSYSVNVDEIDIQHKTLVKMVDELHKAMNIGLGKEILDPILNKLVDYTDFHFVTEEKILKDNNYPDYEEHKEKHEKMKEKVLSLQREYKEGKVRLTVEVSKFLQNWLNQHIMGNSG